MNIAGRIVFLSFFVLLLGHAGWADELELVLQAGHSRGVTSAAWLDNDHLVTGSADGSLKWWNTDERRVKRTVWPPRKESREDVWDSSVSSLLKNDDGIWALYGDAHLRNWDPTTGELKTSIALPEGYGGHSVRFVSDATGSLYVFSPQQKVLKVSDSTIEELDTPNFSSLSVSSDGTVIAGVTTDGLVHGTVGNLKSLPETFSNRWNADDLLLSNDGQKLYVATSVNWVEAWDLKDGSMLYQVPIGKDAVKEESLKGPGYSGNNLGLDITSYGPDGLLLTSQAGDVFRVALQDGQVTPIFSAGEFGLTRTAVSPDLKSLSGGYDDPGKTGVPLIVRGADGWTSETLGGRGLSFQELKAQKDTLFLSARSDFVLSYDLTTGQPSHTYKTGYFPLTLLTENTLYCGGNDGVLYAYDIRTGEVLWKKAYGRVGAQFGEGILSLAKSPDGRQLAVSVLGMKSSVKLVDAATGEEQKVLPFESRIPNLAYSRDGQKLYIVDHEKVHLFDIGYGKVVHSWKKPGSRTDYYVAVLNHPTRESVVGVTRRGQFVEYSSSNLESEPNVASVSGVYEVRAAKTVGSKLLLTADHGAVLTDLNGSVLKTYGHHLSGSSDALALDNVILTTGWDSQVLVWDRETGQKLATLLTLDQAKNWLFVTSDFHFDGTDEAQALIEWRWNGKLYELERFYERFYQPGLLARTVRLASAAPQTTTHLGNQPPKVKLLPPKELEAGLYEINLQTESDLPDGAEVRLYHNGHRVAGNAPYKIKAIEGENRLRASAFNQDRTVESEPDRLTFVSELPTPEQTLHVFAAAINDYPNRLDFAVQDAKSFVDAFEPGLYDKVDKITLYDSQADKAGIVNALKAMECEPQDTLLIFLAGHGTIIDNKFHFIPHGADGKTSDTSLSSAELGKILAGLPATRQVLFLDTCHAGASAKDLAELLVEKETPLIASRQGSMLIKDQKVLARQAGTFLVAGSTPNATAAEVPELGHGLFTYAVLNGLQGDLGKDQEVTVNELLRYLSEEVPELSMKFRGSRHGIWQFSAGQDFPIAKPK